MYGKKVMGIERTTFLIGPRPKAAENIPQGQAGGHARRFLPSSRKCMPEGAASLSPMGRPASLPALLPRSFYSRPPDAVARGLLGKLLVRPAAQAKRSRAGGRDRWLLPAASSRSRPISARTIRRPTPLPDKRQGMRCSSGRPGNAYVYFIYGMYFCLNVSCEEEGRAGRSHPSPRAAGGAGSYGRAALARAIGKPCLVSGLELRGLPRGLDASARRLPSSRAPRQWRRLCLGGDPGCSFGMTASSRAEWRLRRELASAKTLTVWRAFFSKAAPKDRGFFHTPIRRTAPGKQNHREDLSRSPIPQVNATNRERRP